MYAIGTQAMTATSGRIAHLVAAKKGLVMVIEKIACRDLGRGQALGALADDACAKAPWRISHALRHI